MEYFNTTKLIDYIKSKKKLEERNLRYDNIEIFDENDEKINKYNVIDDVNYKINLRNQSTNELCIEDYFYYHEFYFLDRSRYYESFYRDKMDLFQIILYLFLLLHL